MSHEPDLQRSSPAEVYTAEPEQSAAAVGAGLELNLGETELFPDRASLQARGNVARLSQGAEEDPAPVAPGGIEAPVRAAALSSVVGVLASPALPSAGASRLPAGSTSPAWRTGRERTPRPWYALIAAGHGAATFDAWSTRHVIQSGRGHEANPLLRPFAGSSALYGAIQVGPTVLDYFARRMAGSEKRWVRRLWWVPQVMGTAGSLWSGAHNLRVGSR
ncbi:MAG TPA: hypothetical protein VHM88_14880 [Candidatus Acidoferrales bacterium]|nr:hypothetical protein [Candidatus Acidoferrales bacterium]